MSRDNDGGLPPEIAETVARAHEAHMTRRRLIGNFGGGLALVSLGPLLAACGDDEGGGGAAAGTAKPKPVEADQTTASLAPYKPGEHTGTKPPLPRTIAWANVSDAEFFQQITKSMELGVEDRDLKMITANANSDPQKNADQINSFLQQGCAGLCVQPLDIASQKPILKKALDKGVAVFSIVTVPCTTEATNDQYLVGNRQGLAAAKYIKERLGGKANVVYFNIDSLEFLQARHKGVLDGVKSAGPGVKVVKDLEAKAITQEAGFQAMNTILQANPDVNVVLGSDTLVLGAMNAMKSAGKLRDDMYFAGIDGETQALEEIKKGGAYKASHAYAFGLMGYAFAQFTADWAEGKNIPKVMFFEPIELNSTGTINKYQTDIENVREVWNTGDYIKYYENISYDTRNEYVKKDIKSA